MSQENKTSKVLLMAVEFNKDTNEYSVKLAKGSNIAETAFSMSIIIKCLLKDNLIKNSNEVTDLINKYLNDPQYEELKENE